MLNEFILPGYSNLFQLNIQFIEYCNTHHHYLKENYEISGVYGNLPFAIWNGEQANFLNISLLLNDDIEQMNLKYASQHISIYLNCTNTELTSDMLDDTYCNIILNNLERINASNHIVVNSKLLYEYIKSQYKNALIDIGQYNNFLPTSQETFVIEPYCNLFINPLVNNNFSTIETLHNKSQLIFTINPSLCINNCMIQNECLLKEHLSQILFDPEKSCIKSCINWINNVSIKNIQMSNLYIHPDLITLYNKAGINHFMLMHYNNINDTLNEYINYLIKPEFQQQVKNDLQKINGVIYE